MVLLPMTIARAIAVTVAAMPSIRFDEVSLGGFAGLALSPPSVTRAMQEAFQFRIGWLPWASCLFMYKPMSRFVASVSPPIVCGICTQRNPERRRLRTKQRTVQHYLFARSAWYFPEPSGGCEVWD